MAMLALTPLTAIANNYSIAHEDRAQNGSKTNRDDEAVTCQSGSVAAGFVFSDLWQGVGDDAGWLEIGTSYCDLSDPDPKWVWARKRPNGDYYENTLNFNAGNGTHVWKIINTTADGEWELQIDGDWWVITNINGGYDNSADVGLEVLNRMSSTQPLTIQSVLRAWPNRNSSEDWSGTDWCRRTHPDMRGHWNSQVAWRHGLNVSGSNSTCLP